MSDTNVSFPMTPRCHARLRAELRHIKEVERFENAREIEEARAHGDLRENAEYHAAKERQGTLDARMRYLELRVARAQVIDPASISSTRVGFGATVTVLDTDTEDEAVYSLVGEDESDAGRGRISVTSPIARGMLGKSVGDLATIALPSRDRNRELEILHIEYKALED